MCVRACGRVCVCVCVCVCLCVCVCVLRARVCMGAGGGGGKSCDRNSVKEILLNYLRSYSTLETFVFAERILDDGRVKDIRLRT